MQRRRIGVVGGGRFGTTLALELAQKGVEVLFMDRDRAVVQRMSDEVAKSVQGDATDAEALVEAGFPTCDAVVVAVGSNVEASIMATMALKDLKVPLVLAKASTDTHGKVLTRVGADEIIYPERDRAMRLARKLSARSILDYIQVAQGTAILEVQAPESYVDRPLVDTGIRQRFGLTVLAIRRGSVTGGVAQDFCVPSGSDIIRKGDILVLFGPEEALHNLEQQFR